MSKLFQFAEKPEGYSIQVYDVKSRHNLQQISLIQLIIVLAFAAFIVTMALLFNEKISVSPTDLFTRFKTIKYK
ncbi:MAG: hypothetical protein JXA77_05045 [Bacteroidales bacterium]|nr:hypothetical protein [Bacteroidales bacterium]MBN2820414.1 hypothetical protein [Bacteroidales bacterium]